jgi:hypothetical protein
VFSALSLIGFREAKSWRSSTDLHPSSSSQFAEMQNCDAKNVTNERRGNLTDWQLCSGIRLDTIYRNTPTAHPHPTSVSVLYADSTLCHHAAVQGRYILFGAQSY